MTHILAYPASAWDNSFGDYLALDSHLTAHSAVLHDSRPCSASSSSSHLLHDQQPRRYDTTGAWASNELYHFDVQDSPESPLTSPEPETAPEPSVKQEDTQDDFIFEAPAPADAPAFPAFSSMTEVPLRATQATKEMRRMMTVFRLDPFTMHNAVRDPAANVNWNGEPIGPLRQKPTLHEFQLDVPDRVKSEPPPALHHVLLDTHRHPPSRRHRPSPTPSPPLYDSPDSPSLSPLDSHGPSWTASSSDTPSLGYSPDIAHSQPFDTVLTPAQGMMGANMSMNFTSRYSAPSIRMSSHSPSLTGSLSSITRQRSPLAQSYQTSGSSVGYAEQSSSNSSASTSYVHPSAAVSMPPYSSSSSYASGGYENSQHTAQTRQGLAPYTVSTPVRLPPIPASRYSMAHDHMPMLSSGADGNGSVHAGEGADGMWLRKTMSLGMFSSGRDSTGAHASSLGSSGMHLAPPHTVSAMAARRMASSSLSGAGIGSAGGVVRGARGAWT